MNKLRFLDCYEVTKQEKEMISQESLFYDVVKLKDHDTIKQMENDEKFKNDSSNQYTPLPNQSPEASETSHGKYYFFKVSFRKINATNAFNFKRSFWLLQLYLSWKAIRGKQIH